MSDAPSPLSAGTSGLEQSPQLPRQTAGRSTGALSEMTRRDWLSIGATLAGGMLSPAALAENGRRRIRLSLNENPFGPSPLVAKAIEARLNGLHLYAADEAYQLTKAIAARETISSQQIVLGEILDALGLYLAAEGGPGGEFIYSEPGFTALVNAVSPAGGVVVGVPLDRHLENDLDAIAAKINTRTRAVYLVNPHNPSGTVSDAARFLDFVRETSRRTLVIVDEAYLEFEPDFDQRTVAPLVRAGEQVVVFRTFSKIYGLAGLSIGYALVPAELASSLRRIGIGAPFVLDQLALAAATASLNDSSYIAATRAKVTAERETWHALLRKLNVPHSDSRGNFVFFDAGRPQREIAEALADKGIEIGRGFPPLESWVRISIGLPEENAVAQEAILGLLG